MKKIVKLLFGTSILMLILFFVMLAIDYFKVYPYGSAPFYLYVIERSVEFIVPAIVFYLFARKVNK